MSRICILGGGFGGLYTALYLARLPWRQPPEIVLVDKSDRFIFTPFLYELIADELESWEIAPSFAELLAGTGIHFMRGTVTAIDLDTRQVEVSISGSLAHLDYDRLILALGGETPMHMVPGASSFAIPFRTLDDVTRLRSRLDLLEASTREKIRACVVGGGASGVELACKLADRLQERGRVRLVERGDTLLPHSPPGNRYAAEKALLARGIWLDLLTQVTEVTESEISLDYSNGSDTLPVDVVMWTVGTRLSSLVRSLPVSKSDRGDRIRVQATLQLQEYPDVFALGDLAECRDSFGEVVPATAQVAFQQSQYCAWNVWSSIYQQPLVPFVYLPLGEFLSLGLDGATASLFERFPLEGLPALFLRRAVYLMRLPTWQHQLRVGLNWLRRPIVNVR